MLKKALQKFKLTFIFQILQGIYNQIDKKKFFKTILQCWFFVFVVAAAAVAVVVADVVLRDQP